MGDWPNPNSTFFTRNIISPMGNTPLGDFGKLTEVLYDNTAATWTANRAVYQPVVIQYPCTITTMLTSVVTQAGNCDVGIYEWDGTRLVSTGSTAVAAAGTQSFNITDTPLQPGWYYFAFCCDSSTAVLRNCAGAVANMRMCGLQQQSVGAVTLPNPATFATYATAVAPCILGCLKSVN